MLSAGADRNIGTGDGEGPRAVQNRTGYVAGSDSVGITLVNNEFITYTWWGTIRERTVVDAPTATPPTQDGGLVSGIQAVAVAIGQGATPANTDPSDPVYSGDAVRFNADADRPNSPTLLTAIAGRRLSSVDQTTGVGIDGLGMVDSTRGFVSGIDGSTESDDFVAGIGDTLKFNIDIFADIRKLAPPDGDHKLALAITNARSGPKGATDADIGYAVLKSWDDISLSGRNLTEVIKFRYVIQAGDFRQPRRTGRPGRPEKRGRGLSHRSGRQLERGSGKGRNGRCEQRPR